MSKRRNKNNPVGIYVLCITIGVFLGIGLTPLSGNLAVMLIIGAATGVVVAYLFVKRAKKPASRKHSH